MRLIARFFRAKPWSALGLHAHMEGFCLPRFDGVVCISRYTENAVVPLARKTWLVPNAADEAFFQINPQPVDPPEILCVATIDERKNQNAFIDAVAPLAGKHSFRLRFFGAMDRDSAFGREFISRMDRYSAWCSHGGMIGRDELRAHFRRATALVLPSHEDNCPMTVLEAMAAGVPVLASRVGGVPDLVEDGVTGLFCDPAVPETMRQGLHRLLTDVALRNQLARTARETALERFHPKIIAQNHLDIYREVLGQKLKPEA
jgi:glycosyltransferase involved in cell wall biosynthesis